MKKWQELSLSAILNFAVGLALAGIIAMILEDKKVVGGTVLFVYGSLLWLYAIYKSRKMEG
jgi:hypothetical protein